VTDKVYLKSFEAEIVKKNADVKNYFPSTFTCKFIHVFAHLYDLYILCKKAPFGMLFSTLVNASLISLMDWKYQNF